jgi:hypothetical protein
MAAVEPAWVEVAGKSQLLPAVLAATPVSRMRFQEPVCFVLKGGRKTFPISCPQ